MITMHGYMKINKDHRTEFLEKVKDVIAASRAETGNISYNLYENTHEQNHFVMLEEWQDEEAIEIHGKTEHFQHFLKLAQSFLLEAPVIKRIS
ncbi:putative quinol monooxygenase [Peribacillus simplex]|uniref:putative quinol monooxygenase n=1 Tax=Peribacillus simplex TaxID=1478 RepID=UPI00366AD1F6